MFKTAARILLLRVLPRRLLPIVTVVELAMLLRKVRGKRPTTIKNVNPPTSSRTAPPAPLASTPGVPSAPDRTS